MIRLWKSLSPFTRRLAIVVVVASAIGLYTKARLKPMRSEVAQNGKTVEKLRRDVRQSRDRVQQLRREADASQRWASYALVLDQQSTGRSLRDVLETCGTQRGPQLKVHNVRFERRPSVSGFGCMGVSFRLEGRYAELIRLLHDLDATFPPIEITRTELKLIQDESGSGERGRIEARLEGVIYEPR